MAHGIDFENSNLVLGPPRGQEADVYPLPVHRYYGGMISCWRLQPAELEEIQRTGVVWVHIMGGGHPPIFITGSKSDVFQPPVAPG